MKANVRVGSTVEIQIPNGRDYLGQCWKTVKARVHMVVSTHVVCVVNRREARPYCADHGCYRVTRY